MSAPRPGRFRHTAAVRASSLPAQVTALAHVLDVAEGRGPGHAARVAFIARALTDTLLPIDRYLPADPAPELRRTATLAGLLHDAGVPLAAQHRGDHHDTAAPGLGPDERLVFAAAPLDTAAGPPHDAPVHALLQNHVDAAHDFLAQPFFPPALAGVVAAGHENWDGSGYPQALAGERIPAFARILRAADLLEAHMAVDSNPFRARAHGPQAVAGWRGRQIDPLIADALDRLLATDDFWLRLHDDALEDHLFPPPLPSPSHRADPHEDWRFAAAVAALIDRKAARPAGHALRLARTVHALAGAVLRDAATTDALARAALWNDVGFLALPQSILHLPALLSVEQMERVHLHPRLSADVVAGIPGLHDAVNWVRAHHERLDGKGYPDGLHGAEIPIPAGILSLADAYVAMTSPRPHRPALSRDEAIQVITAGAGRNWAPELVDRFLALHRADRLLSALPID